jgi:hypothetical protein
VVSWVGWNYSIRSTSAIEERFYWCSDIFHGEGSKKMDAGKFDRLKTCCASLRRFAAGGAAAAHATVSRPTGNLDRTASPWSSNAAAMTVATGSFKPGLLS